MPLTNQHIVIIGGSSGIGRAVAEGALAEGARVTIGSSRQQTIDTALENLSGATGHVIDVKDDASVAQFFGQTGEINHLVFTAGDWDGPRRGSLESLDIPAAQSVFGVRFWGALRVIKQAQPHMHASGSIAVTNGMIAHNPTKGSFVSTAMAGAIEHLTRALAVELQPIRVNCVCPGLIRTDVWNSIPADQREERLASMTARLPLPRAGKPEETAEAYLYLMRGGYTTGQVLMVDGGASI